jgi:hypothetical protein
MPHINQLTNPDNHQTLHARRIQLRLAVLQVALRLGDNTQWRYHAAAARHGARRGRGTACGQIGGWSPGNGAAEAAGGVGEGAG